MSVRPAGTPLALSLALSCALLTAPSARSAGEYLVQDLGQQVAIQATETLAPLHAALDGIAYFYRDDGIHGRELWRSDGTPLGTFMVRDICPGACGSETFFTYGVLAAAQGHVYFTASDGIHGAEPWVTDGTALGTRMIADLQPGPRSSDPDLYREALGQVFFRADDGLHGWELFRTDGTSSGTYLVGDLDPSETSDFIRGLVPAGGYLYFYREDGMLYRTDGSAGGTIPLLVDAGIYPFSGYLRSIPFAELPGGDLLFQACEAGGPGAGDCELWRTDGSVAGTQRVVDLEPGPSGSSPVSFLRFGDEVVFESEQGSLPSRLYRTDGTAAGTLAIPLPPNVRGHLSYGMAGVVGDLLFFTGCSSALGCEPWVWGGSTASLVADLNPGPESSLSFDFYSTGALFADVDGTALFVGDDGGSGRRLWRTDGTAAGTVPLTDFGAPPEGSYLSFYQAFVEPIVAGGRLFLTLFRPDRGMEIWRSDGTAAGTGVLRTIADQASAFVGARVRSMYAPPFSTCFAAADEGLYFAAGPVEAGASLDFDYSNGQPGQVEVLRASLFATASLGPSVCTTTGSHGVALAGEASEGGVWVSDGTSGGTSLLLPLDLQWGSPLLPTFGHQGDRVYFSVLGNPVDTFVLQPAASGLEVEPLGPLTTVGWGRVVDADERLFFGGSSGLEITDGGSPPIPIYGDPIPPYTVDLDDFAWTGSSLFFSHWDEDEGTELWWSEGDSATTGPVRALRPGPEGGFPVRSIEELWERPAEARIASIGPDRVVFSGDDGVFGQELWVSDGTAAGTQRLVDLMPGPDPSSPRHLVSAGSIAYFAAEDPATGLELWRTDGTVVGTFLVRDLVPGMGSSIPEQLAVQDGILYFSAWTPAHGREAWRSDGTFSGTYRLTEVAPGPLSSSPSRFTRQGDRLFFVANDHVHGFELWVRPIAGSELLFADGFESADGSRWSANET